MKKNLFIYALLTFTGLALSGLTNSAYALPSECLQAPQRQLACPHMLYKSAALPIEVLNIKKNDVICICLSDLKALNNEAKSKVEEIDQQVTLQRLAKKYQLREEDILTLVKD